MIYTIRKAEMIAEQLRRFTTSYDHHLAGQFANIDFWLGEIVGALNAIDEHRKRFKKMYNAQQEWVEIYHPIIHDYCPICEGVCEFSNGVPSPPRMKYKQEKIETRKQLVDSAYNFLIRCYKTGLFSKEELEKTCNIVGTGIDPEDLL